MRMQEMEEIITGTQSLSLQDNRMGTQLGSMPYLREKIVDPS